MSLNNFLVLLLSFLLYSIFSYPPLAIIVFLTGLRLTPKMSLVVSFMLGLGADYISGDYLGIHCLLYLGFSAITILYLRTVSPTNKWYMVIATIIFVSVEFLLLRHHFSFWPIFISPIVILFLFILTKNNHGRLVLPGL